MVQAEARGLPEGLELRGVAQLLVALLRLDRHEASGRVRAAHATGTRHTLTGQPLAPLFAVVAGAQAEGSISERHARIVVETVEKLPDPIREEVRDRVESDLVGHARMFDPVALARIAERVGYCYDPDGRLADVAYREKQRELTVQQRPDGSATLRGEATAELTELLLTHFDALAKPRPEIEGIKDPRTAGQRRHDALLEALRLNLAAQQLPAINGLTATLVLTMTADAFEQRRGLALTSHGALIPVPEAMRIAAADYRLMNVVLNKTKAITSYSSLHRLATEQQRLAIFAADGPGCSFPNCPMPIHWCQTDHATDHAHGGPTRTDNLIPACRYHNLHAKKHGWQSTRINGHAAWIPPPWIDKTQTPRYNHLHRTEPPDDS